MCLFKCITGLVSENALPVNYPKNRKHIALFDPNFCNVPEIFNVPKKNMSLIGQLILKLLTPKDALI